MTEKHLPKCLQNRLSSKGSLIASINALKTVLNEKHSGNYKLLLVTPFGMITGDSEKITTNEKLMSDIESNGSSTIDLSFAYDSLIEELTELEAEGKEFNIIDNGSFLNLTNVSVYQNNLASPIFTINQMIVFVDQIISVSLIPQDY